MQLRSELPKIAITLRPPPPAALLPVCSPLALPAIRQRIQFAAEDLWACPLANVPKQSAIAASLHTQTQTYIHIYCDQAVGTRLKTENCCKHTSKLKMPASWNRKTVNELLACRT